MQNIRIKSFFFGCCILVLFFPNRSAAQKNNVLHCDTIQKEGYLTTPFLHPGMAQSVEDLIYMREMVLKEVPLWKNAFDNLKKETSLDFIPQPVSHVSVGPYGSNDMGGKALFASARSSYDHALMWYITRDKRYAEKTVEILNAWSYRLWSFDANNAKLNVGLTGYFFLNAAEIIRYSYPGWKESDIRQFERMLLTVFYPVIEDFFTEANGNWDASMINTMMCIGVFTDRHDIFNRAVERYYRGNGNGGITRYIYPGGQCQETTRDWDHVQLGIGEFAKAARVACTQGLDFYSVADYRLAEGFEYAAKFLIGDSVTLFGTLSYRDKDKFRDIYESIYVDLKEKGIRLPYTEKLILDHTRMNSSIGFLTAAKQPKQTGNLIDLDNLLPEFIVNPTNTGALNEGLYEVSANTIYIHAGENIQEKIDAANPNSRIILRKGIHLLDGPLIMKSNITLSGEGKETILFLKPEKHTATIVNADKNMQDVIISDLLIEGAEKTDTGVDPNYDRSGRLYSNAASREGIIFVTDTGGQLKNIELKNITVQNFTKNGVYIVGAKNISILNCDITNNGSSVVPGSGFHHNLKLSHAENVTVSRNRLDDSLWGNGLDISFCVNVDINRNEISRNKLSGIVCSESENVIITENLIEGNDQNGIFLLHQFDGNSTIQISGNKIQNNNRSGIFYQKQDDVRVSSNICSHNGCDRSGE